MHLAGQDSIKTALDKSSADMRKSKYMYDHPGEMKHHRFNLQADEGHLGHGSPILD